MGGRPPHLVGPGAARNPRRRVGAESAPSAARSRDEADAPAGGARGSRPALARGGREPPLVAGRRALFGRARRTPDGGSRAGLGRERGRPRGALGGLGAGGRRPESPRFAGLRNPAKERPDSVRRARRRHLRLGLDRRRRPAVEAGRRRGVDRVPHPLRGPGPGLRPGQQRPLARDRRGPVSSGRVDVQPGR